MAYIYQIINTINQKSYIGKTEYNPPETRWKQHLAESRRSRSNGRALYRAIHKYGVENFQFVVLEETAEPNEREKYYIKLYNTYHDGYNETLGGDGAAYLELPEQEICDYYLAQPSLKDTAAHFQHDVRTIKKVLEKYNIAIVAAQKVTFEKCKQAVARIDPKTNEILQIYNSVHEAEQDCPTGRHIGQVCSGKRRTAGGFKWQYVSKLNIDMAE